jgi:DNA-binding transcriptional ArsR family regulator
MALSLVRDRTRCVPKHPRRLPRWVLAAFLSLSPLALSHHAFAQGAGVDEATAEQKKEAQSHYDRGVRYFEAKKYDDAYQEFSKSYGVVRSPNAHMMMARALLSLGQHARAYNELGLVEAEAQGQDRYTKTLELSRGYRAEAAQKIAVVTPKITGARTGPTQLTINDVMVPLDAPYGVNAGTITARVTVAGKLRDEEKTEMKPGEQRTIELDLGAAQPTPGPLAPIQPTPVDSRPSGSYVDGEEEPGSGATGLYVGGGILVGFGLTSIGVGIGMYAMAKSDHNAIAEACGTDPQQPSCPTVYEDHDDDGRLKHAVYQATTIAGSVMTALGATLIVVGAVRSSEESSASLPRVRVGPGSVVVDGNF